MGVEQIQIAVAVHVKEHHAPAVARILGLPARCGFRVRERIPAGVQKMPVLFGGGGDPAEVQFILAVVVEIRQRHSLTAVIMIEPRYAETPGGIGEPSRRARDQRRQHVHIGIRHHFMAARVGMQIIRHEDRPIGGSPQRIFQKPREMIAQIHRFQPAGEMSLLEILDHLGELHVEHHHQTVLAFSGDDLADDDVLEVLSFAVAPGQQIIHQRDHGLDVGGESIGAQMNGRHRGMVFLHVRGDIHGPAGRKLPDLAAALEMALIGRFTETADKIHRQARRLQQLI
ncbi:MAG: hypothetical protein BWY83_02229 [bacterium ADurb.Bin478]|nr:MAG: hypothetical protein BWY83_02229 [bacterium ADurb.Bin478]